jgi:hypothetical protein
MLSRTAPSPSDRASAGKRREPETLLHDHSPMSELTGSLSERMWVRPRRMLMLRGPVPPRGATE